MYKNTLKWNTHFEVNKMKYRIPIIFSSALVLFVLGISVINQLTETKPNKTDPISAPVSKVGTKEKEFSLETLIIPVDKKVPIVRYYYEEGSENNNQALDYFEGVYRKSQGIDYGQEESFEVVASLSGVVSDIKEDTILGLCVTIDCENNLQLVYQSLSNVGLKKGDSVAQGSLIGESGHSIYEADLGNHLHFMVLKDGQAINPLKLFDKKVSEIN